MARGVKTGGRTVGTPNKVTAEFRETVRQLLERNSANVARWLELVAEGSGVSPLSRAMVASLSRASAIRAT